MKTSTLPPHRPASAGTSVPIPLWERGQLFREPVYPEGLALLEDEDDALEDEG